MTRRTRFRGLGAAAAVGVGLVLLTLGISLPAQEIADSFDDWSTTGTQGENNWFYGWYNLTEDEEFDDGEYAADDFNEYIEQQRSAE